MMKRAVFWLTAGALLVGVTAGAPGWAASPGNWGVVDMDRLAAEYRGMQDLNQQFQEFQREQERQLQEVHKSRLLADEERQELLDLSQMAAPTESRDKRLAELEGLSDQRERRLFELRKKTERTAAEKAEYQQLNELYEKRMGEAAALQADLQQSRLAKYEELSRLVTDSVNGAVKAVAEEKKLAIVLRKEVVLHGGVDITEEVLGKLNAEGPS